MSQARISFEKIGEWLTANDWVYQPGPTRRSLRMRVKGEHCVYEVFVALHEDIDILSFFTLYPLQVPENRRAAMAEAVARANDGMNLGGFQFDLEQGRLRFVVGIPLNDGSVGEQQFMRSLYLGIHMCERYFGALMRVLFAQASPKAAIAQAENPAAVAH